MLGERRKRLALPGVAQQVFVVCCDGVRTHAVSWSSVVGMLRCCGHMIEAVREQYVWFSAATCVLTPVFSCVAGHVCGRMWGGVPWS